jgi:hypothetical protein
MCVDSGGGGLEHSRHSPEHGVSATAPRQCSEQAAPEPGNEQLKSLKTTFFNLAAARETEKALEAAAAFIEAAEARVIALERRVGDASRNNNNESIIDVIRTEVKTAVQTAIRETGSISTSPTTPRSWASIASSKPWGAGATAALEPRVVVPARREREVVVRKGDGDPLQRTPIEVVRAVNSALGSNEAVAARRLQSGDTLVTFNEAAKAYKTGDTWITEAFGTTATRVRRELTVIARRLPQKQVRSGNTQPDTFLAALQTANSSTDICRVQPRMPQRSEFATLLIGCRTVETAQKLCRNGLLWEAQIFDCEPYYAEAEVRQCYKCLQFGHHARFCKAHARCGHCAAAAHAGGEAVCPQFAPSAKKRCVNCSGSHTAWTRSCPDWIKQRKRAEEAYTHRPRQFEIAGNRSYPQTDPVTSSSTQGNGVNTAQSADSDGFTPAQSRKRRATASPAQPRPRGRPAKEAPRAEEPPRRGPIEAWAMDNRTANAAATQPNTDISQ